MSSTRNTRGSKILNAAAGPSASDLEVTVQNLSHALQAVTARLSALEQLKLELETLRDRFLAGPTGRTIYRGPYKHPKFNYRSFFCCRSYWC
ncbi:hypothetical protein G6F16_012870 [Rhizopus arrhizus]|nr:hypothetical protein G6F16_012870 [Rhizopus arrhizus]